MCDLTTIEMEKLKIKKKLQSSEESWESEPDLEKIQREEEQPIEIIQ